MRLNQIANRLRNDYFMPSRIFEYEELVIAVKKYGYIHTSVRDALTLIRTGDCLGGNLLVQRHDIDTDVKTAKEFFRIEKKHGVKSTFYFRLSTLDYDFMREIEMYGSEVGYHYEEIATYAKKNKLVNADSVLGDLEKIRESFLANIKRIRVATGLPIKTVASHGDFANRKLKIPNYILMDDECFRRKSSVDLEVYDYEFTKHFPSRVSDSPYPDNWDGVSPFDLVRLRKNNIYILTHPRQWRSSWLSNSRENLVRLYEGIRWGK